jgi:hypothetical protein
MSDTAIRAENLSKKYRLGVINRRMLVDQIESWVYRKLGKPDPHAPVFGRAVDLCLHSMTLGCHVRGVSPCFWNQ